MNNLRAFAAASCLGLASLALAPSAMADQWNKKTIITVGEAIQVPGKVLQPGKYVMKLLDSPSSRHVVQIFNERKTSCRRQFSLSRTTACNQPAKPSSNGGKHPPASQRH